MVTRRDDAKSELQIKQDVYAYVTRNLRERIESEIVRFGTIGFQVNMASVVDTITNVWNRDYREFALAAINDVVQEYQKAGWAVSCQQIPGSSETGPSNYASDGAKILLTFR
jgi:hypothetical protein